MPELRSSKVMKTGDEFTATSDLENNEKCVYFRLGIGKSVESFWSKFIVPRYLKYFCLIGLKSTFAFL